MEAIIHCGLNKTGTSSLQHFLACNSAALAKHGVLYPSAGRNFAHHEWALHNIHFRFDEFDKLARNMFDELCGEDRIVLSSEAFQDAGSIEKICDAFRGAKIRAVFYLRDYVDYFNSWWREGVRSNNLCMHFRTFAVMKQRFLIPILWRWAHTLGKENVSVRLYDRNSLIQGDIRHDFLVNILNLQPDGDFDFSAKDKNPSISGNLLFVKRLINTIVAREDLVEIEREMAALMALKESFTGRCYVDESDVNLIRDVYTLDRDHICKEFGILVPMEGHLGGGAISPELCELPNDVRLIERYARERDFAICKYLDRFRATFTGFAALRSVHEPPRPERDSRHANALR